MYEVKSVKQRKITHEQEFEEQSEILRSLILEIEEEDNEC